MMRAVYKLEERYSPLLGPTYRPMVDVKLWSDADRQWQNTRMIIDTGADYTLLPRYFAVLLSIDLKKQAKRVKVEGIGGGQAVFYMDQLKVKLGPFERYIPVSFADTNAVPPLMGRHMFFETFKVEFNYTRDVTFSES